MNITNLNCVSRARKYLAIVLSAALIIGTGTPQFAPEVQAQVIEEVVVQAQRRAQSLQDVPIAVTALGLDQVEKQDIHDLTDIATRVPGLTFSPFSPGQNIVSLRGVSSNDDGAGTDNSVAVFVDDIYLGRVSNINPEMFDIEQIEVLRGPQGVLYGKNTIGGAINVISTKPSLDDFVAKLKVNIGNYNRSDFSGLFTGPIGDNVAAKFAFSTRKRDGWVTNVVRNEELKDDDRQAFRGQVFWKLDGGTEVMLTADYNNLDVADMGRIPLTQRGFQEDPAARGGFDLILDAYRSLCGDRGPSCTTNPTPGYAIREAYGLAVRVSHSFDTGEFISITGWRESKSDWNMDSVGIAVGAVPSIEYLNAAGEPLATGIPLIDDIDDDSDQISQEFRWVQDTSNGEFVVGLWLFQEETDRAEAFIVTLPRDQSDRYRQINETTSYAIFGQYDLQLRDDLILSLGARYSYDKKDISTVSNSGNFVIINGDFELQQSADWDALTPKVALNWKVNENTSVYASYSEGFKSGGFPAAPFTIEQARILDQEEAQNIEFGVKSDVNDRLRVNATVFFTDYTDLQLHRYGPAPDAAPGDAGQFETLNTGDATANGVEVEIMWLPIDNLNVTVAYGFLDTEFGETLIPDAQFSNQAGQDLFRAPENKYNITLDYTWPLNLGGSVNINFNYSFTDDQRGALEPTGIQPAFDLIDLRIAWRSNDEQYEVAVWGKNLANEEWVNHLYPIGGQIFAVYGYPRFYGVSVTWNYQ